MCEKGVFYFGPYFTSEGLETRVRSVQMLGNQQVTVADRPEPLAGDGLVTVKVEASAICGSERHSYFDHGVPDGNGGHEAAGTVVDAGGSTRLNPGDRVALHASAPCGQCCQCCQCCQCWAGNWVLCESPTTRRGTRGNHAQYVALDEARCLSLPDDVSLETGSLLGDVLGTPFRAIQKVGVTALDRVLIMGQGPVGLAATMICKFLNAHVVVANVNDYRLEQARACGADETLNPLRDDVLEVAPEVALDCTGNPTAQTACLDAARVGGRVALIGVTNDGPTIDTMKHFTLKELTVYGSWYSTPMDHLELIELLRRGLPADQMITHRFDIEDAPQAFSAFFNGEAAKVIITPWG